jgi:hypothetical protein
VKTETLDDVIQGLADLAERDGIGDVAAHAVDGLAQLTGFREQMKAALAAASGSAPQRMVVPAAGRVERADGRR